MKYLQHALPLNYKSNYNPYDFIVSFCNLEAYNAVTKWHDWPHNRMLIIGEIGSGKSHLANIWHIESNSQYLKNIDALALHEISPDKHLILENLSELHNENSILHLINFAAENELSLLMTSNGPIHYQLPDLRSRMNATCQIFIKQPDIDLMQALLAKHFSDKQLKISMQVIEYISSRISRSFKDIAEIVEYFDKKALERKREITIPFVKEIMQETWRTS